ncbi:type II toxin-antitoxin system death-on-curing family toxin [Burkholderia gladioli]|uniref:type II toxin-antitoxin system death-on-curing family toxin n=1 Tax=Burkholderia gladioli TaxID=28095 RepID=UPI001C5F8004|nr:type II toxin-antitoxin system death-on-curing family toxin [Burkholderia gladioli]MBW5284138.1 type II toxin-antitoxin system death-on-curing family toxin [Burkholderia gladioli]
MSSRPPISAKTVLDIHDEILRTEPGLSGDLGIGRLEGALSRVQNRILYEGLEDVFGIAAMYAVALARGHVFNDANKRTALVTALTYLSIQGVDVPRSVSLEDMMVDVAEGNLDEDALSDLLYAIASSQP